MTLPFLAVVVGAALATRVGEKSSRGPAPVGLNVHGPSGTTPTFLQVWRARRARRAVVAIDERATRLAGRGAVQLL